MAAILRLDDYLEGAGARPWKWGSLDCCFFAGDWVLSATGRDPLESYRGRYDSAAGARRLIIQQGGLIRMVRATMARANFDPTQDPEHGDIGIMRLPVSTECIAGAAMLIRYGRWWIGRGERGIIGFDAPAMLAWSVA